ncbi:histidine phosphatase family protein [Senegalia massiliensis]|jgi:alpha-ribazole phosphatase|uniref:histidine phosphatase family protein n=1 Tax=Senegalia massiliensis TaxID=1720316 RepID=UPI001030D210|nr:histidine phosphatase family protein [Senegalia massiliensis]
MKLILLRHPETIANSKKVYIGQTESKYTDRGRDQFDKIVNNFDYDVDYIYTSPMTRCKILAKGISEKIDTKLEIIENINELNFGIFENKNYKQVEKLYPNEWRNWIVDYINYAIPEGESLRELYTRVEEFLNILKKKDGKYLLVTHGGVIQTIIALLLDLDIDDRWHFKVSEGSLVEIDYIDDYGVLKNLINY